MQSQDDGIVLEPPVAPSVGAPAEPPASHHTAALPEGMAPGPETMRRFRAVLANTLIANVTSSYLWYALTFWAYLETRSVLATSIIGGSFMLLIALSGMVFGTLVDRHRKRSIMVASTLVTLVMFLIAGALYLAFPEQQLVNWNGPLFWVFVTVILIGGVVESMRNIALSTTVTLLVPADERDKANGLVGTVQGVAFMVTSVFSGLSVGLVGLGGTLAIAVAFTLITTAHLLTITIPERKPARTEERQPIFDFAGAWTAIRAVPGLLAMILFATFNNLVGGVFMSLMDPYGLTLFDVKIWGVVLGVTSIGFIIGGLWVAKFGLGKNPVRSMLVANIGVALLGVTFTIREYWWLYAVGILAFMCIMPIAEAAEQTILQKVVPFETQGRVFGFAQSIEAGASPISAFLIGPIAEFWLIPFMATTQGRDMFGWLLGDGEARGIALVFTIAGAIMLLTVALALISKPYRVLSATYARS